MAGFRDGFEEYFPPSSSLREEAIKSGLICLDTNVLLDAYRFRPEARMELLNTLKVVEDRLWIPHQVAFEFHKNRISVIGSQGKAYKELTDGLEQAKSDMFSTLEDKARKLTRTISLSTNEGEHLLRPIATAIDRVIKRVESWSDAHGIALDRINDDPVLRELESILDGRVGSRLPEEDEVKVRKEAESRAKKRIPPGYKDVDRKEDGAGDYIIWVQLLREAKQQKKPIIFVTRDVKEDWFWRVSGRTLSARPELIREARKVADVDLLIMETKSFLFHVRKYLKVQLSNEFLQQVEDLPPIDGGAVNTSDSAYEAAVRQAFIRTGYSVLGARGIGGLIDFYVKSRDGRIYSVIVQHVPLVDDGIIRLARALSGIAEQRSGAATLLVTNAKLPIVERVEIERNFEVEFILWRDEKDDLHIPPMGA
ncbi:hypothetical protein SAMN05443665_1001159 [Actinomadura meyerae]|uniref:PIN like domain-containing protein n=1 Tax=Actinomadura meyerae TaxID=240840 RepID=A0A239C0M0_9ACTN|nr:PIN-like domain-containing protein [Actinomadura meyerae]SNS13670.1 hypothetical protein SAMN05443665_1001159 [Actinomadura meyerae]